MSWALNKDRAATWIVDTQKHLQEFTGNYLSYYDATILAGQCARMMARVRGMEIIDNLPTLSAMATSVGILPTQLRMVILPTLEHCGVINIKKDGSGKIHRIEEHVPTEDEILKITYDVWEGTGANEVEKASIFNLDQCSIIPRTEEEIKKSLEKEGFKKQDAEIALELQASFQILKKSAAEPSALIYSPYVWGENAKSIVGFVSHLDKSSKEAVEQLLRSISLNQGVPLDLLQGFPADLFTASRKTGLVDVCQVTTKTGIEKGFAFTPRMWGSLGGEALIPDTYDDVKLFLSSIGFGQHYSNVSKIKYPVELVEALINKGQVGPATAIGTDFLLLEKQGIVKVVKDSSLPGRYNMYLAKEDVAKTALEVLKHKRVLGLGRQATVDAKGLFQTGDFVNPEQDKIRLGKLSESSVKAQERLIRVLRGEEL